MYIKTLEGFHMAKYTPPKQYDTQTAEKEQPKKKFSIGLWKKKQAEDKQELEKATDFSVEAINKDLEEIRKQNEQDDQLTELQRQTQMQNQMQQPKKDQDEILLRSLIKYGALDNLKLELTFGQLKELMNEME